MLKQKNIIKFLRTNWYYSVWIIYSFVLTFIMQWIQLKSLTNVFQYIHESTFYFSVNFGIVLTSMSLVLLVKRKVFIFSLVTFLWGFLSLANAIVIHFRGTPLMFSDVFLIKEAAKLIDLYFTPTIMIGFVVVVAILFIIMGFLFKVKSSVKKIDYAIWGIVCSWAILGLYVVEENDWMAPMKSNYTKSYQTYGFSYSILNTIYPYLGSNQVVYNDENMDEIMSAMALPVAASDLRSTVDSEAPYNLIVIQLESFMDPLLIQGAEYSEDPIATFRALTEVSPHGYITVPTFGAGTVMTEFEVLTSISMSALKPGEIPYDQLLCTTPVQSLATIFNSLGYQTTFLHNYEGNFYNRHLAIRNLGFDVYVPLEYMAGDHGVHQIDKTDDGLLFDYVIKALEQSEEQDFIYAVTAGTHQPYSLTEGENAEIIVSGTLSDDYRLPLQDYVNRMHSLDTQIARIVDYINQSDEPTLLVFFSDHLPNLSAVTDESTYDVDLYHTPYLIYSNAPLEAALPYDDMTSYQLGAYALNLLSIQEGAMHKIHDLYATSDDYQETLDLVQKDLLYGEGRFYEGRLLPTSSNLFFGLVELQIEGIGQEGDILHIYGNGFSSESRVYLDQQELSTTFVSSTHLQVVNPKTSYQTIEIKQHSGLDQAIGQGVQVQVDEINRLETA
ncbi:MAG: LTA synthase family protein [Turicibacter sp.]|nr:LTA synthase family protein [Turicibacter sp.]